MLSKKSILITGGTGSFGKAFVKCILQRYTDIQRLVIFSRDLAPIVQPGAEFYGYASVAGGRTIVFAGGMPLERDGVLVGAVGVSGGDAIQDQRAADQGVAAFSGG